MQGRLTVQDAEHAIQPPIMRVAHLVETFISPCMACHIPLGGKLGGGASRTATRMAKSISRTD